jgi:hypothetical protein
MLNASLRITRSLFGLLFLMAVAAPARGVEVVYDLTAEDSTATINGAIFKQIDPQATGTGLINSFVQIGQPGGSLSFTEAYNTTVNGVLNNGASDQFNHALSLSSVPTVTVNGTLYREFVLDINETGATPLLSVADIQVYLTNNANQAADPNTIDGKLIYQLDQKKTDNSILLDYSNNHGSGSGDMTMLILDSLFDTKNYSGVVLYSSFGKPIAQDDGFEEWFVCVNKSTGAAQACTGSTTLAGTTSQVPEPSAMLLLGAGLLYLARVSRKKQN